MFRSNMNLSNMYGWFLKREPQFIQNRSCLMGRPRLPRTTGIHLQTKKDDPFGSANDKSWYIYIFPNNVMSFNASNIENLMLGYSM